MRVAPITSVICIIGLFVGCQQPRLYHPACNSVIAGPKNAFYNAFIELDDQGEFLEPGQLTNAVARIKASGPVYLVAFFHGWKNNADFDNENLQGFSNVLQIVSSKIPDGTRLFGVYVSWRGDPVLFHYNPISWTARQLSFWPRLRAAERVAGTSATEALFSILQAAKVNPQSKVILVGHSMGALILEKALSQAFVSDMLSQTNQYFKPPADLVLLLNSAAPSIYARQLITMLHRQADQHDSPSASSGESAGPVYDNESPLLISVTSKGDWATGKVFPLGMWFSSQTKCFRNYPADEAYGGKQTTYYRLTSGNNKALLTHDVDKINRLKKKHQPSATPEMHQEFLRTNIVSNLRPTSDPAEFVIDERRFTTTYKFVERTDRANKTPYWVMRVPTTIIADHGDIFNERSLGFIAALVRYAGMTNGAPQRKLDPRQFAK